MCFILTAIKLKENDEVKNAILNVMQAEQADNPHGTGSLCYSREGEPVIKRDMYMTVQEMRNDLDSFDIVNYHFRTATIGVRNLKNVHFWKNGNWAFCHNGTLSELGDENESDSFQFFNNLIAKKYLLKNNQLKGQKIKEYTNSQSFWGRFLIINLKTKNIYFFGDFELTLLNKSYLVFTSANANFENKLNVMGLTFDDDEVEIKNMDSKIDGVWMLDYATQEFSQIFETFKEVKTTVYPQGHTGGSRPREGTVKYLENAHATGKEELDNLNSHEVIHVNRKKKTKKERIKANKLRDNTSYIKEFMGRMDKEIMENEYIEIDIEEELAQGMINEMGRTDTEQAFWDVWMTPQLKEAGLKDFPLRDLDLMELRIGG